MLQDLSPAVKPFYDNLQIIKEAREWPELPVGTVHRVSVNSFGFGGANGHVILEKYERPALDPAATKLPQLAPFLFSAASEKSLTGTLAAFSSYLTTNPTTDLRDLSWTLSKRSTLPVRLAVAAQTAESLISKLDELAKAPSGVVTTNNNASSAATYPSLLGIFTGQGAQWPAMGAHLLSTSKLAHNRIESLQESLNSLPTEHVPAWSLREELLKDKSQSRVGEAAFSQPLCTAVQILLVDHLKAANVRFSAVVGHSSGEIAAAYTAGYLSAQDAIRVAYYRGFFLHLARGPGGSPGGMLAVGTSQEDAQTLCDLEEFTGWVVVAASNSPESQTLSGDLDAVEEVKIILEDEGKFARLLKVDKAYHSHHMIPATAPYVEALTKAGVKAQPRTSGDYPSWISSVYGEDIESVGTESLGAEYWSKNMANQVLFTQAVEYAVGSKGPFDLALEVGPHPALKSPALQTIQSVAGQPIPYAGTLRRGANDVDAFAEGLGSLWSFLGAMAIDIAAFDKALQADRGVPPPRLLKDAPAYVWDHDRVYWHESRYSKALRTSNLPPHQLLGTRRPDGTLGGGEVRWKNHLHPREVPWLVHHQVERAIIFPAAGYLSAALEAVVQLYGLESVRLVDIHDVNIGQALVLEENSDVETLFSLRVTNATDALVDAVFTFYSASAKGSTELVKNASGRLRITLGSPRPDVLPTPYRPERHQFLEVETERFYNTVGEVGLGYTGPFRKLSDLSRRRNEATGLIQTPDLEDEGDASRPLLLHPGTLDCAIQSIILAHSYPGDGRVRSIYLPTVIETIRIDPAALAKSKGPPGSKLPFYATITSDKQTDLSGDVEIHSHDGSTVLVQLQGLRTTPLTPPAPSNDLKLFFETSWESEFPTGNSHMFDNDEDNSEEFALSFSLERVAYYYVHQLYNAIPPSERAGLEWHHKIFYEYIDHVVEWVSAGTHPYAKKEWTNDSREVVLSIIKRQENMHHVGNLSAMC